MNIKDALTKLDRGGSDTTSALYLAHGANHPLFGVKQADILTIAKEAGIDPDLARDLWRTKNHDARVLACYVANPKEIHIKLLREWVHGVDNFMLAVALATLVSKTQYALQLAKEWTADEEDEFVSTTGWHLATILAKKSPDAGFLGNCLIMIEDGIDEAPPRTRQAMVTTLVAIGTLHSLLTKEALRVAKSIGQIVLELGAIGTKFVNPHDQLLAAIKKRKEAQKKAYEAQKA